MKDREKGQNSLLISVIMSVYNDESNITDSVNSILFQTEENLEFLIIDDGSTDNTFELLNTFKDKRIKIFKNENNIGLTKSLNKLINSSKGEYIARQDSDDFSIQQRFQTQIEYIKDHNLDACTSRALIKSKKRIIPRYSYYFPNSLVMKYKNPFIHGSLMIKKDTIMSVGLYNEKFKYAQDYKLFDDLINANYRIGTIKEPLYYLNMENNISTLKLNEQQYYADCVRQNKLPE